MSIENKIRFCKYCNKSDENDSGWSFVYKVEDYACCCKECFVEKIEEREAFLEFLRSNKDADLMYPDLQFIRSLDGTDISLYNTFE